MNIKSLMTAFIIALISAFAAQAADVVIFHREAAPAVITAPTFSWTGFYFGGQVGNFSSKTKIKDPAFGEDTFTKECTPNPSGFMGGVYLGSNIDLGSGLILGVETDAVWAGRKETKELGERELGDKNVDAINKSLKLTADADGRVFKQGEKASAFAIGDTITDSYTYKEKWSGATRIRLGLSSVDRIMPYVAGGIAYTQVQGIHSISGKRGTRTNAAKVVTKEGDKSTVAVTLLQGGNVADRSKTMVGFTIGGGVDFAVTDNILLRAEYRYSDFGKKKVVDDTQEFHYKTNDFRVGVAYKL
ncbi:outer membrane protein [Bartonella rattaustraliani]|uniref:outer membrane protein n=1 Tax=Bartonella rattaustraliani TaxID=481139 RepID=UPI0002F87822|nr:outer membrane protein [Bartonella rattaustraliani]